MKIAVVGNLPDEESYIHLIDSFVKDHKVGTPVILSAGDVATLHIVDKYAKNKGYDSVILGNALVLAVLNADKLIVVWDGEEGKYMEVVDLCKRNKKAYMEIKTK